MRTHLTILGWLQILLGIFDLLIALLLFGVFAGVGLALAGEGLGFGLLAGTLGTAASILMVLTGLPNLLAGAGLLARKGWARILALILAVFNLLKFPWGTALAAYTFWVLMDDSVKAEFEGWS